MPSNIVPVSFMNPADAVNAQAAQADIQRRQALAQQLQQMSLAPIDPNGGRASWMQGVAKVAQALVAAKMYRDTRADTWDMIARQQNAQAALHDPTGTAIPQVDLGTNPYRHAKALAAGVRAAAASPAPGQLPSATNGDPATDGFDARAAADGAPLPNPKALAAGIRATMPTDAPAADPASATGSMAPADRQAMANQIRAVSLGATRLSPTAPMNTPLTGPGSVPPDPQPAVSSAQAPAGSNATPGKPDMGVPATGTPAAGGNTPSYTNPTARALVGQLPLAAPASPPPSFASSMQQTLGSMTPEDGSTSPYGAYAAQSGGSGSSVAPVPAAGSTTGLPTPPPPQAQQPGGGEVMDALIPTMSARNAYMLGQVAPDEYWKAVAAAGTPIDDVKRLVQSGIDPHSPQGQKLLRAAAAKAMETPVGDDRRGYIYDPYTGKPIGFHPQISNDATPVLDAQGNVVGETPIQGAAQTIETIDAAKARGAAAGQTEKVWDPSSGTYKLKSRADVLSGVGAPAGGYQADPRPGLGEGLKDRGIESSKGYTAISNGAADVNTRIDTLRQAARLARNGTPLGPGSQSAVTVAGFMNSVANSLGMGNLSYDDKRIATIDEFNKLMNRYAMQQAKLSGTDGTDAARALAIAGNPHAAMTNTALAKVFPNVLGFEYENKARAAQATAYANKYGVDTLPQFNQQWTRNSDPRIYRWMAEDELSPPRPNQPGSVARNMAALKRSNPRDYAELVRKSQVLGSIGALP